MAGKEIKIEKIFNDEKREAVKKVILEHINNSTPEQTEERKNIVEKYKNEDLANLKPFELYLIILGERSTDYSYTPEIIYEHIEYFRECWKDNLSCYKALEFFSFELDNKKRDEKNL